MNSRQYSKEMIFSRLGAYLREKREKQGYSQGYVAKQLGYSNPQFVSNIERGLSSPPLQALKKLVVLYKIPEREFMELLLFEKDRFYRSQLFGIKKRSRG